MRDVNHFENWAQDTQMEVRNSLTEDANLDVIREECKKYEGVHRTILANAEKLEALNQRFCHLASDGRTDISQQLVSQIQRINYIWDELHWGTSNALRHTRREANLLTEQSNLNIQVKQLCKRVDHLVRREQQQERMKKEKSGLVFVDEIFLG